jgi:N-acetylneuraminic acid mutarotase
MPFAVRAAAAASDGERIFVFGGTDPSGAQTAHTQIFDPEAAVWTTGSAMPEPADFLTAARAGDGIHVLGGLQEGAALRVHRVYHPSTDSWDVLPPMPTALHGAGAEVVDERLFVLGGVAWGGRNYTADVHVYDIARAAWSVGQSLPSPRLNVGAVVTNGSIHLIGGGVPVLETTAQHLIHDVAGGEWTFGPPLPVRREALGAGSLDGGICVFGGRLARGGRFNTPYSDTYCLELGSDSWILSAPLPTARAEVASVTLGGSIYAIGGHDANDVPQATVTRLVSDRRALASGGGR